MMAVMYKDGTVPSIIKYFFEPERSEILEGAFRFFFLIKIVNFG